MLFIGFVQNKTSFKNVMCFPKKKSINTASQNNIFVIVCSIGKAIKKGEKFPFSKFFDYTLPWPPHSRPHNISAFNIWAL